MTKPTHTTLKEWYFSTFDEHDVNLIQLQSRNYSDGFQSMISQYRTIVDRPESNTEHIEDSIKRMEKLDKFQKAARAKKITFNGEPLELSNLVEAFEPQRHSKYEPIEPPTYLFENTDNSD